MRRKTGLARLEPYHTPYYRTSLSYIVDIACTSRLLVLTGKAYYHALWPPNEIGRGYISINMPTVSTYGDYIVYEAVNDIRSNGVSILMVVNIVQGYWDPLHCDMYWINCMHDQLRWNFRCNA